MHLKILVVTLSTKYSVKIVIINGKQKKILLHYENNYVMVFYLSHGILLLPRDKKFLTLNPWSYIVRNGIGDTLQPL